MRESKNPLKEEPPVPVQDRRFKQGPKDRIPRRTGDVHSNSVTLRTEDRQGNEALTRKGRKRAGEIDRGRKTTGSLEGRRRKPLEIPEGDRGSNAEPLGETTRWEPIGSALKLTQFKVTTPGEMARRPERLLLDWKEGGADVVQGFRAKEGQ